MQSATALNAPVQVWARARRWPTNLARAASAAFVLLYFFVFPLCYCPHYYLELSLLGLVPLFFGPRLYRWFGAAVLLAGLLSAEGDRRGAIRERQQILEIRAQADAQTLRGHTERRPSPAPR